MNTRSSTRPERIVSFDGMRSMQTLVNESQALLAASWDLQNEAHLTLVAAQKLLRRMTSARGSAGRPNITSGEED